MRIRIQPPKIKWIRNLNSLPCLDHSFQADSELIMSSPPLDDISARLELDPDPYVLSLPDPSLSVRIRILPQTSKKVKNKPNFYNFFQFFFYFLSLMRMYMYFQRVMYGFPQAFFISKETPTAERR
jgi:hypothetical protein